MPKTPTTRFEMRDYLATLPSPITTPVNELFAGWLEYRRTRGLPPASSQIRAFRGVLARMEELGELRVVRTPEGRFDGLELTDPPAPGLLDRIRSLERERAMLYGRFIEASGGAGTDLYGMRTPALNAYVRRRRAIEQARRTFRDSGMDPTLVAAELNPLGEEALALKERVLRLEVELLAYRELGAAKRLAPVIPDTVTPVELEAAPLIRGKSRTRAETVSRS
jgi:hypothetical protein